MEPKPVTQPAPCNLLVHQFTRTVADNVTCCYQVLKMKDSVFIWIGSDSIASLEDLSVAMKTTLDNSPLTSRVLGGANSEVSTNLASRLCKRMKKQVFVSYNLTSNDLPNLPNVEKKLVEEIVAHPNKF